MEIKQESKGIWSIVSKGNAETGERGFNLKAGDGFIEEMMKEFNKQLEQLHEELTKKYEKEIDSVRS